MADRWYDSSPDQLARRFGTSLTAGLTRKEALRRIRKGGSGNIYPVPKGNFRNYLRNMLTDFTSILLLLAALLAWYFNADTSALVILGILALNFLISAAVFFKAGQVLEDIGISAQPTSKVMRSGRICLVKSGGIVPGDMIFLSAGDLVPADARLVEDQDLTVLESRLTGSPHSTVKSAQFRQYRDIPPAEQKNMVFASSVVTAGSGRAIVCAVGEDTLLCRSGLSQPILSQENLRILTLLRKYCRSWSLCMVAMIFLLTAADVILNTMQHGLLSSFLTGLTLAVASMSEFYIAFGYILVACGIYSAAHGGRKHRKHREQKKQSEPDSPDRPRDMNTGTTIKNTSKLEVLKDLTALAFPKEALISVKDIRVERVWANDLMLSRNDPAFRRNSAQVLRYAVISTGLYGARRLTERNLQGSTGLTYEEKALIDAARECGFYTEALDSDYPIADHRAAGGTSRYDTTLFRRGDRYLVALRGEAQKLLADCAYYRDGKDLVRMTIEKRADFASTAERITRASYRVLAVATRESLYTNLRRVGAAQSGLILEGFIAILEPLLPGVLYTVSDCLDAGIKMILFTEEESEENISLARSLGILKDPSQSITGRQLSLMRPGIVRLGLPKYRLYQGLSQGQKQHVLQWLQESGEQIGVMALRFGELPLLRQADVAFTQSLSFSKEAGFTGLELGERSAASCGNGEEGCEALKFVSDVIVAPPESGGSGGCNAMVTTMMYARSIYKNILRLTSYLITAQTARFLMVLAGVLTGEPLFRPVQILFSGLIIDLAAVMILAFEPPSRTVLKEKDVTEQRLSRVFLENWDSLLYGLLWAGAQLAGVYLIRMILSTQPSAQQMSSAVFLSFIVNQMIVLLSVAKEGGIFAPTIRFNAVSLLVALLLGGFIALSLSVPAFGASFGIVPFGGNLLMILIWVTVVVLGASELKNRLQSHEWPFTPRKKQEEGSFFLDPQTESADRSDKKTEEPILTDLFRDFDLAAVFESSLQKSKQDAAEAAAQSHSEEQNKTNDTADPNSDGTERSGKDEEEALPSLTEMLRALRHQAETSAAASAAQPAPLLPMDEPPSPRKTTGDPPQPPVSTKLPELSLDSLPEEVRSKILSALCPDFSASAPDQPAEPEKPETSEAIRALDELLDQPDDASDTVYEEAFDLLEQQLSSDSGSNPPKDSSEQSLDSLDEAVRASVLQYLRIPVSDKEAPPKEEDSGISPSRTEAADPYPDELADLPVSSSAPSKHPPRETKRLSHILHRK